MRRAGLPPFSFLAFLLSLPLLLFPHPFSPFLHSPVGVCHFRAVLLLLLLCAICQSTYQGWVPACFLFPPSVVFFLCSACLLCAPSPCCLRLFYSLRFPVVVAGCPGSLPLPPPFCVRAHKAHTYVHVAMRIIPQKMPVLLRFSDNSVSTLTRSYGRCQGRCLIRFLMDFPIKWCS